MKKEETGRLVDTVLDALGKPIAIRRRHLPDCEHKAEVHSTHCRCPIFTDTMIEGKRYRRYLSSYKWADAIKEVTRLMGRDVQQLTERVNVVTVLDDYLLELKDARITKGGLRKWRPVLDSIKLVSQHRGLVYLDQWDKEAANALRKLWADNTSITLYKKEERAKHFFSAMVERGAIRRVPFKGLPKIQMNKPEVMPFSDEETAVILTEANKPQLCYPTEMPHTQARRRALIYLLRWSGLRMGDAWNLRKVTVKANQDGTATIITRMKKTGHNVSVTIPAEVFGYMCEVVVPNSMFWFHREDETLTTASVQRTLQTLFRRAGLPTTLEHRHQGLMTAHPHRFRHTFACDLLAHGVPIEEVSELLGHESVRITERHYKHWVPKRQQRLDRNVRATWDKLSDEERGLEGLSEEESALIKAHRMVKSARER